MCENYDVEHVLRKQAFRCYEAPLQEGLSFRRSVRPPVSLSVRPSVCPSVTLIFQMSENARFRLLRLRGEGKGLGKVTRGGGGRGGDKRAAEGPWSDERKGTHLTYGVTNLDFFINNIISITIIIIIIIIPSPSSSSSFQVKNLADNDAEGSEF